jgi:hypothetical protein
VFGRCKFVANFDVSPLGEVYFVFVVETMLNLNYIFVVSVMKKEVD